MPTTKRTTAAWMPKAEAKVVKLVLLAGRQAVAGKQFRRFGPIEVVSTDKMRASLPTGGKGTLWIIRTPKMTEGLLKAIKWPTKKLGNAVLLYTPSAESLATLSKAFDRFAYGDVRAFLAGDELAEVLKAPNCEELLIGGTVDRGSEIVTLWRGNLDALIVPFSAFPVSGDGIRPDFDDFSVIDSGQTIRFGEYEAAAEAVFYEYDSDYRRRKNKERKASDRGLGPSIRRLRIQRGLRQEDFPGVAAKTIARIEQGKVQSIHDKTRRTIAEVLHVDPGELDTF